MAEKYFQRLTSVSLAIFAIAISGSCSSDKTDVPIDPPVPKTEVSLSLTAGKPTERSLAFKITTSDNADRVAYVVALKDDRIPDADMLISWCMV